MVPEDFELKPTVGVVGGLTIQFAEGRWQESIGDGVALTEKGFDRLVPCLRIACPEWTDMHRYGVFELPVGTRAALVTLLKSEAARARDLGDGSERAVSLFDELAAWLDARCDQRPISILGV